MSKKDAAAGPRRSVFGRMSNNLAMGIVGLANVGKSTFFNVLTNSSVPAENYPFCTIDPSTARAQVPDERWHHLCASEGKGLGNAFLSNISAVDGIFHMIRIFEDEEIIHVEESIDPVRDLEIVSSELRQKDIEILSKKIEGLERIVQRTNDKQKKQELDTINKCLEFLKNGKDLRFGEYDPHEVDIINQYNLLTVKPVIFLINMNKDAYIKKKGKWLAAIKTWVDTNAPGEKIIPFSAEFERDLSQLSPEEQQQMLAEVKVPSSLSKIIVTGYSGLGLIHFFTAGADEVKCWTVRVGSKAPRAAGVIHTDFERGFIAAEVFAYADFKEHGSEGAVRAAGKYHTKGRDYEVQDGDVILFRFNVTAQKKK
ncbi:MAG: putative Ribosome-binding ATPase YchF [Streblomastix strix]|uniref:Obg-like ATPase homolog n=1 Tax=Streblomastix strix TaxID=222440 RepID=A0A5J4VZE9_9EUKA|nr:MAG: putative Ribosome-binding ATPase YchF [Streblomastix strix]